MWLLLLLLLLTSPCAALRSGGVDRRAVLSCVSAAALAPPLAASADASNPFKLSLPERDGLKAKWLEQLRVVLQDEADNLQYGGELAPGGPPSAVPALLLVPIVQMEATLAKLEPSIADETKWDALMAVITSPPFEAREFKRIFNAYSDNIYYASGSSEANAYLLGGATPSTAQTTQYLLRNEALRQLGELKDEILYQKGLPKEKRESDVAAEALQACRKAFADYLKLAAPNELKIARAAVYGEEGDDARRPNKLERST